MKESLQYNVEEEMYTFLSRYYRQEQQLAEYWKDFFQENDLKLTKRNHLHYTDLLLDAYKYLKNMVSLFAPPLLQKLELDIQELNSALTHMITDSSENSILYKKFLKDSTILNTFKQDHSFSLYYDDLCDIFFEHFQTVAYQYKYHLISDLKNILNQKTTLFEYILWDEANNCQRIKNSILFRHIKVLNTKNYIEYMLEILAPYSNKHTQMRELHKEVL